jgi:tRNA nucleotidyltransferase (CCA-adding enzyme)
LTSALTRQFTYNDLPFTAYQWELLTRSRSIALALGMRIYLVGGVIRDYLLGNSTVPNDIDLVSVGGSALLIARQLRQLYPQFHYTEHPKFHTAELSCAEFTIDLASARREVYAYPSANPQVELCDLETDLYRRDFTVNALAVELLDRGGTGALIDLYDGLGDLTKKQIKPIRAGSFAEDPRRIFRAVRLGCKCGLHLSPATRAEIMELCASGLHDRLGGSRLKAELIYILQMANHRLMCRTIADLTKLGAWRLVDPQWHMSHNLSLEFRRLSRWHRWFAGPSCKLWQMGLELWLRDVDPEALAKLHLSPTQIQRITALHKLLNTLPNLGSKPSSIVDRLQREDIATVILAGAVTGDRNLWHYLTKLRTVKPLLSAGELQALGYPKGKLLGQLLNRLLNATLDGEIHSKTQAIELAQQYWPKLLLKDSCSPWG